MYDFNNDDPNAPERIHPNVSSTSQRRRNRFPPSQNFFEPIEVTPPARLFDPSSDPMLNTVPPMPEEVTPVEDLIGTGVAPLPSYYMQNTSSNHLRPDRFRNKPYFQDSGYGSAYSEGGVPPVSPYSARDASPTVPDINVQPPSGHGFQLQPPSGHGFQSQPPSGHGFQPLSVPSSLQSVPPLQHTRGANGLYFLNYDDSKRAYPTPDWRCPRIDPTIPTTDAQRRGWVVRLVRAVNNVHNVHDKDGKVFEKRWYHPVTGPSNFFSREAREMICWNILDMTERLHHQGPGVLKSLDPVFWKQAARSKDWTFQERMDHIIEILTVSKSRCDKLFAGFPMDAVVGHPQVLVQSTKGNAKQNKRRQDFLEKGRELKKEQLSMPAGVQEVEEIQERVHENEEAIDADDDVYEDDVEPLSDEE